MTPPVSIQSRCGSATRAALRPTPGFQMTIHYRNALPNDAATCIDLRGRTRENAFSAAQLAELGITTGSWAAGIADGDSIGRIACEGDRMVGYCFADRDSGEVLVLALLPDYEGRDIGRQLLQEVVSL